MMGLQAAISSAGAALLPITQSVLAEAGQASAKLMAAPRKKARSEILAGEGACAEKGVPHMMQCSVTSGFHHCRGGIGMGSMRACRRRHGRA